MSQKNSKSLADNFLIVIIGLIASCIAIFAFVTGYQSLGSIIPKTPTPVSPTATLDSSTEMLFATATAYASQRQAISQTDPSSWFPSQEYFPSDMFLETDEALSNENAAKLFTDPSTIYLNFEKWERITGHHRTYYNQYRCEARRDIAYIEIQTSLYSSTEGVNQIFDYYAHAYAYLATDPTQMKETYSVGEYGYIVQSNNKNFCTLENDGFRTVRIFFKRQVAFIYIEVSAISDTIPNEDVVSIAMKLAQYTDGNLKQFSK